jgi:endonuclease YncB( thermonuclease family)
LFQGCSYRGPQQSYGYSCGLQARAALIQLTMGLRVFCTREEVAGDSRAFARCWEANAAGDGPAEGAPSLNETMVTIGWALADRTVGEEFRPLELDANRNNLGMHTGGRVTPANWRRGWR